MITRKEKITCLYSPGYKRAFEAMVLNDQLKVLFIILCVLFFFLNRSEISPKHPKYTKECIQY